MVTPAPGCGVNGQLASGAAGAGAHAAQAHAAAVSAWAQTFSVIANGQPDAIAFGAQMDGHARGAGVARDVGQRFLHDAEQVRLGFIGQALVEFGSVIGFDAGALAETGQPASGCRRRGRNRRGWWGAGAATARGRWKWIRRPASAIVDARGVGGWRGRDGGQIGA